MPYLCRSLNIGKTQSKKRKEGGKKQGRESEKRITSVAIEITSGLENISGLAINFTRTKRTSQISFHL